jgi:hypothetical protein
LHCFYRKPLLVNLWFAGHVFKKSSPFESDDEDDGRDGRRRRRQRANNRNRPPHRNRRRARDDSDDDDDGDGGSASDGNQSVEDVPVFEAVPCGDLKETEDELGLPGPRCNCFACMYVGQDRAAKIPDHRLAGIFKMMADSIGESWPPAAAVAVAKNYAVWRKEINLTRKDGEEKLPKWNAASVLDHWYNHTLDPEISLWLDMMAVRYTINTIRAQCLERRHRVTKERRHDKDQWAILNSAIRLYYTLSAKDPRKLNFYKEGAMINWKYVSNKGFSTSKRPVYSFMSQNKRLRNVGTVGLC